jgi:hypothetical protein
VHLQVLEVAAALEGGLDSEVVVAVAVADFLEEIHLVVLADLEVVQGKEMLVTQVKV